MTERTMATRDMSSHPLVVLTGYVEGVMFAILLGNIVAPVLDEIAIRLRLRRLARHFPPTALGSAPSPVASAKEDAHEG